MSDRTEQESLTTYRLDEIVCQFMDFRGRTPLKLGMQWGGGDIRALSANNVQMGRVDFDKESYFGSEALYRRWMTKGDCRKGDVLLTTEAPLGNVAQVPDDSKYILSQRTILLKAAPAKANPDYLFQLFRSEPFQAALIANSTGTTVVGIQVSKLAKVEVAVPSVPEQRKIARILTTVDNLIEKTEALIAKYQAIKQGMMHDLFTRGVDEHGHLRPPYEDAPELYKQSELGWIPKAWEVCSGESLADLITKGESPTWQGFDYQDDGVLFVTSENVREGFIDVSTPKFIPDAFDSKLYRSRLAHGDVLINLVGASIGRTCRVPDSIGRANINQAVCLFRAKSVVLSNWIAYYFQLPEVMTRLAGEQVETARANVSLTDVREFKFPVPSDDEMRQVIRSLAAR